MGRGTLGAQQGMARALAARQVTYDKIDWATHQTVMHEMGQDGSEGEGYVSTSRSWAVNAYLRTDGDMTAAKNASCWSLTESDIKQTIRRMDSQMKPLTRNIQAVRFVGPEMLKELGVPSNTQVTSATANDIQKMIQKGALTDFTPKAYSSFSTDAKKNVFTSKRIKINYKISKGTPCIMTANSTESEGILGRGVKHKITGARWVTDGFSGKLEIDVTV